MFIIELEKHLSILSDIHFKNNSLNRMGKLHEFRKVLFVDLKCDENLLRLLYFSARKKRNNSFDFYNYGEDRSFEYPRACLLFELLQKDLETEKLRLRCSCASMCDNKGMEVKKKKKKKKKKYGGAEDFFEED